MNAKTELAQRICTTFPGGTPITAEAVTAILKDYIIIKDSDDQRSDLNRRIKYYLGAKRIDGLSERTLKNYKNNLEMFAERMNKSAAKITTDDIRGYIGYLAESRHLAETSLQTHINTLRAFFGWLHNEEKIKKNPMSKIKSLKLDKKGARQALTVEELERLRDACQGYREKALVEFLVSSGCRLSEVAQLSVSDLDLIGRTVRVTGKGDKDRQVYFSVRARLMVQEYMVPQGRHRLVCVQQIAVRAAETSGDTAYYPRDQREGRTGKACPPAPAAPYLLRRMRSTAAWTSQLFRNCWGMRTYRRRKSMRKCRTKQ